MHFNAGLHHSIPEPTELNTSLLIFRPPLRVSVQSSIVLLTLSRGKHNLYTELSLLNLQKIIVAKLLLIS